MKDTLEKISDTVSETVENVSEMAKERIFAPMYFYFLCAWIIANWKFVYTLIFTDEKTILETQKMLKLDYLAQLYDFSSWLSGYYSILHLIVIPIIASFIVVWWLSTLSEKFYQKHEQHQVNKRVIKNYIEYEERVGYELSQREIRNAESDKKSIKYINSKEFNDWYDNERENIKIGEYEFLPSEALYNNDYEAYKIELENFNKTRPDLPF